MGFVLKYILQMWATVSSGDRDWLFPQRDTKVFVRCSILYLATCTLAGANNSHRSDGLLLVISEVYCSISSVAWAARRNVLFPPTAESPLAYCSTANQRSHGWWEWACRQKNDLTAKYYRHHHQVKELNRCWSPLSERRLLIFTIYLNVNRSRSSQTKLEKVEASVYGCWHWSQIR